MLAGVIITVLFLGAVGLVVWAHNVTKENERLEAEKAAAEAKSEKDQSAGAA